MPDTKNIKMTAIKYGLSAMLVIASLFSYGSKRVVLAGLMELLIIFTITNLLPEKHHINRAVNSLMMLLLNLQYAVLILGGSYVQYVMLTNISSAKDLSGKSIQYILAAILVVLIAAIPVQKIGIEGNALISVCLICAYVLALNYFDMVVYSPGAAYIDLAREAKEQYDIKRRIDKITINEDFHNDGISNYVSKPNSLPEKPNVIVIFTEGLSEQIIDDERNIMPNVRKLKSKALVFSNYFNHTAPTYKGLLGQLTSGYQRSNLDRTGLTSIQEVFKDEGYRTTFINVEPNNQDFSDYLADLGFDDVITDEAEAIGLADAITDKDAYGLLWETISDQNEEPLFLCIYTLGTHVSFNSPDMQYGQEDNDYLSKFYNSDYWFGEFLRKFEQSEFAENTVIIYTTDHATWKDNDYTSNFQESQERGDFTDRIPFYIYHKGVRQEVIDAKGRNSLDFAPTILDYLDMDHENYFLGESLFGGNSGTYFDTLTQYEGTRLTTRNEVVEGLDEEEDKVFINLLEQYFAVKKKSAEAKGLYDREGLG